MHKLNENKIVCPYFSSIKGKSITHIADLGDEYGKEIAYYFKNKSDLIYHMENFCTWYCFYGCIVYQTIAGNPAAD